MNFILNYLRARMRCRNWAGRLYWLLAKKHKAVCFNCGQDFKYTMEDPGAPNPWTEQGKMPCIPCYMEGVTSQTPMRNHGNFDAWRETKL